MTEDDLAFLDRMHARARGLDVQRMYGIGKGEGADPERGGYEPTDYRKEAGLPPEASGSESDEPTWTQRAGAAGRQVTRAAGRALTFGLANQLADATTKAGAVPPGTPGTGAKLREMFFGNVMDRGDGKKGYTNTLYNDKESEDYDAKLAPGVGTAAEVGFGLIPSSVGGIAVPGGMARELGAGVERTVAAVPRLASRGLPAAAETLARGAAGGAATGAAYSAANAGAAGEDPVEAAKAGAEGGGALGAGAAALAGGGRAASRHVRDPNSRSGELIDLVERVGGEARPSGVKGGRYDDVGPREEGTRTLLSQTREGIKSTSDIAGGRPLEHGVGNQRGAAHDIVDDLGRQHEALDSKLVKIEEKLLADQGNVQVPPGEGAKAVDAAIDQKTYKNGPEAVEMPGISNFKRFRDVLSGGDIGGKHPTISDLIRLRREADSHITEARGRGFKDTEIPWIKVRSALANDIASSSDEVSAVDAGHPTEVRMGPARQGEVEPPIRLPDLPRAGLGKAYREYSTARDALDEKSRLLTGRPGAVAKDPESRTAAYDAATRNLSREGTEGVAAAQSERRLADLRKAAPEYAGDINQVGAAAARDALKFRPQGNPWYPARMFFGMFGSDAAKARLIDPAGRAAGRIEPSRAGVPGSIMFRLRKMAGAKDEPERESGLSPEDQREYDEIVKAQEAQ